LLCWLVLGGVVGGGELLVGLVVAEIDATGLMV